MNHNVHGLNARLSICRCDYARGEDIVVTLSLSNTSDAPLTINIRCGMRPFPDGGRRDTWETDLVVTYENEACPRFIVMIRREQLDRGDFATLDSGSQYLCDYQITRYFIMDQPGDYDIQAVYQNGHNGQEYGLTAWTGQVVSNTIRVRVVG